MKPLKIIRNIVASPLNRGRPLRAVWRFVTWQISSRLAPGSVLVDWVDHAKFIASPGERGLTCNIYSGLYEFQDMAYLLHVLRPEDVFVDVGANVGSYTILACGVAGARGYAFEPVPATYEKLLANLRVNDLEGRVQALNQGLGETPGQLRFSTDQRCVNHVMADGETGPAVEVAVVTLDASVSEPPAMIKIDVEGFESSVLAGAALTLAKPQLHSLLVELNGSGRRYGYDDERIVDLLEGHGFRAYEYRPFERDLQPLVSRHNAEGNTLFIRDIERARSRVQSAAKIHVLGREI
jgi:FkbM family methyltransferase